MSVVYKLYFHDRITGKKILRQEFSKIADLKKAWLATENADYLLTATKETEIINLPKRGRAKSELIY